MCLLKRSEPTNSFPVSRDSALHGSLACVTLLISLFASCAIQKKALNTSSEGVRKQRCRRMLIFDRLHGCKLPAQKDYEWEVNEALGDTDSLRIAIWVFLLSGPLGDWAPRWRVSVFTFVPFVHLESHSLSLSSCDAMCHKMKLMH